MKKLTLKEFLQLDEGIKYLKTDEEISEWCVDNDIKNFTIKNGLIYADRVHLTNFGETGYLPVKFGEVKNFFAIDCGLITLKGFPTKVENIHIRDKRLGDLKFFPKEANAIKLEYLPVKTLEGLPKHAKDLNMLDLKNLKSLKGIPSEVKNLTVSASWVNDVTLKELGATFNAESVSFDNIKFESLTDIRKCKIRSLTIDRRVSKGLINVLLINGLETLSLSFELRDRYSGFVKAIMVAFDAGKVGRAEVLKLQSEQIEAGNSEFL